MPDVERNVFRHYLGTIPDELLAEVAADCAWLAEALSGASYQDRVAMCREERERRRERPVGALANITPIRTALPDMR